MFRLGELGLLEGEQRTLNPMVSDAFSHLVTDSRNILYPSSSLFFAIKGQIHDGHRFIAAAYKQGVKNFVVSDGTALEGLTEFNAVITDDVVAFMQRIAVAHRNRFPQLTVIGITGSNGKTVVKEWLSALLSRVYATVKTPKSYNSQIGVALSVWGISQEHEVAVLEAGISECGEMERLQRMIQPQIGIFTNLGDAHESGFPDRKTKLDEKLRLFREAACLVYRGDDEAVKEGIERSGFKGVHCNWGYESHNALRITKTEDNGDELSLEWKGRSLKVQLPSHNKMFFENAMHCICTGLWLNVPFATIEDSISSWQGLEMRLQLTAGKNDCLVVNDSYTNDLQALAAALDFSDKHKGQKHSLIILSEMEHAVQHPTNEIFSLIAASKADEVWLAGNHWQVDHLPENTRLFSDTQSLISYLQSHEPQHAIILVKGSRKFGFERVYNLLSSQSHTVSLEIDLAAIEHNLSTYGSMLQSSTRLMPIIKASAYGAGSEEIAKLLQHKGVYALGVAFADEGAALRKAGITLPITVLNADSGSFQMLLDHRLDLEIYSLAQLREFIQFRQGALHSLGINLKLDTGMSRLGFREEDLDELLSILRQYKLNIISIFSHLSSSEDEADDVFTHLQARRYLDYYARIVAVLGYQPKKHLLNSAGIVRFPEYHFDLVRLGLGLYGIDTSGVAQNKLEKVHTLKARVIQIKKLQAGDYVGYNRRHKVESPMTMGVLNIGYADGFMRRCGNSRYEVMIRGTKVPVIGNVCMDLSMVDLSHAPHVQEGDDVILFGKELPIESMAEICETIPYEILCRIAPRIQRRYQQ